ncbi:GNAT family N-acetyltransferase [Kribbella sp. NPDC058693]|uniref:GNAT family N-acetyltransferase n=1 Tax=Kribbella sp. NPDC058693 TaxID=3346602 RepID=UPI00365DE367
MSTGLQIRNNATDGAFEAVIDGEVVGRVGYRLRQERVVLTHTEVDEAHRGKGIANQLVQAALDDAFAAGRSVTNFCPFIADYIADHPSYKTLVDPEHPGGAAVPDRAPRSDVVHDPS